jgi:hypothetical protein
VDAFDIVPDALGLPDDEPPRLKPGYREDPRKPMSLIEFTEACEPSAHGEALKAALGSRLFVVFGPDRVLSQFKHEVLVPALRDPGRQDLVERAGRFLEAALGAEKYISDAAQLQVFEGIGIEDAMVARLVAAGGPLVTDALRQYGYPVPLAATVANTAANEADDYGSVSVVLAVLGGLPPGSVPAMPGDSLRIWPRGRALRLTCPRCRRPRPGPPR